MPREKRALVRLAKKLQKAAEDPQLEDTRTEEEEQSTGRKPMVGICPWCGQSFRPGESTTYFAGHRWHPPHLREARDAHDAEE